MFDKCENRLLAELDPTDYALLRPHLSTACFARGEILQEQEAPVTHVYFPMSGLVSLVSVMENGQEIRKRAKDRGVRFGRPRKLTAHQRQEALQRIAQGETQADIARLLNVSPPTISRLAAASPFEHGAVGL
jgi:CRP-like cAMP-binding protein